MIDTTTPGWGFSKVLTPDPLTFDELVEERILDFVPELDQDEDSGYGGCE